MITLGPTLLLALVIPVPDGMHEVGPGALTLAYPVPGEADVVEVPRFFLDERPVANAEMLAFVTANPAWQREQVPGTLADERYLAHWAGPLELGDPGLNNRPEQPVTHVSWFAARAYCRSVGKRLPTEREWELAASADERRKDARADPAFQRRILDWYGQTRVSAMPAAGSGAANAWGVRDLHGLVWEWVHDFNATLVTGDDRDRGTGDGAQFCGAGAVGAQDVADYATFMRFAFRSSLGARYTTKNLGFRCAADVYPGASTAATSGGRVAGLALELEDQAGERVTSEAFVHDGPLVVSMFYASCSYACPTLIRDLVAIDRALSPDARARTRYLLVTFDPVVDTPERLSRLMAAHGLSADRWTFARTLDDDRTRELAAALGITYRRLPDGNYNHTSVIHALDRQGNPRAKIEGLKRDASAFVNTLQGL